MRGVVFTGEAVRVVDDLEVRAPRAREVRVRIEAAGLCHTDLSLVDGTIPHPTPLVLGHEGAGTVLEVGADVTTVRPGDHVVLTTLASCGMCSACERGLPTRCRATLGVGSQPFTIGGEPAYSFASTSVFSEEVVVAESQAVVIDRDIPMAAACLIGCGVITGAGTVWNRAKVQRGETAAVFGLGGVGLSVIQGLRIAGAGRIVAIDTEPAKEALARKVGATDFLDARDPGLAQAVRDLEPSAPGVRAGVMNAGGLDWVFDCVGNAAIVETGLEMLDWGGTVVIIGVPRPGAELTASFSRLIHVDRTIMGCRYGSVRPHHDIPLIVELYRSGAFLLDEMVSATMPIERYDDAVDLVHQGTVARVVFTF
jgi:Zn-dependent alcohol dehydrogenase